MDIDVYCYETHARLERQGIGSPEMTIKALSFLDDLNKISQVADFACGTGGQTMILAQNIAGKITGVDIYPQFIDILNDKAKRLNLQERVKGIVGNIVELPFQKEKFDLIWSEGVIDTIGFEKGISYWKGFLKMNGYIAVTCPSWLTNEHPAEVKKFWGDAGIALDTVGHNISIMEKVGYSFIAAFALPENCWTENYFIPREEAEKKLSGKYTGDKKDLEDYVANNKHEAELFSRYKEHYGYIFYIGKKL